MVKSNEKECQNYFCVTRILADDHYDMVKCLRNTNFEEMDNEASSGKNEEF